MINANFVQSNPLATNHSRITLKEARNDPCLDLGSDFCRNNGLCYVDDDDNFACQCRYGYIGTYCEIPSLCLLPFCLGGGTCKDKKDAAVTDLPKCTCKPDREGDRCEKIKAVAPAPNPGGPVCDKVGTGYCNVGNCAEVNGRPICECPVGYSGNRCEFSSQAVVTTKPDVIVPPTGPLPTVSPGQYITCAQSPCNSRGTCYDNGNTYYCLCYSGYTGPNCASVSGK